MARRTIPSQEVVTCDRCGEERKSSRGWLRGFSLRCTNSTGLDYTGSPVGPGRWFKANIDFCDRCAAAFDAFIDGG